MIGGKLYASHHTRPRLLARASYPVLTTDIIVGLTNTLGPGVENADRLVDALAAVI